MSQFEEPETINGIDPDSERLISLKEAAKLSMFCRDGRKPNLASLYRWVSPLGAAASAWKPSGSAPPFARRMRPAAGTSGRSTQ